MIKRPFSPPAVATRWEVIFVNITEVNGEIIAEALPKSTNDDLQNEYDYLLAESITEKMLERGLISSDEFDRIMRKNREKFSPFIGRIFA